MNRLSEKGLLAYGLHALSGEYLEPHWPCSEKQLKFLLFSAFSRRISWLNGTLTKLFVDARCAHAHSRNTRSRIENMADEFDMVLFGGLVMRASPVSDS